jgi:hypothetical protein
MRVKLFMPAAGSILVEVDEEVYYVPTADLIERPREFEFPIPVVLEADEPVDPTISLNPGFTIVPHRS